MSCRRKNHLMTIAAPEHLHSSKVALYISGVILARAIMTLKLVVSRTHGS